MMLDRVLVTTAARHRGASVRTVGLQLLVSVTYVPQAVALGVGLAAMVEKDAARLGTALGTVAAIAVLRTLLTWLQARSASELGARVRVRLRDEALRGALVPAALHDPARRDGALRATLVDGVDGVDAYVTRYLPAVAQVLVLVPVVALVLAAVHPVAGLVAGVAAAVAILTPMAWRRAIRRRSWTHWDTYEALGGDLLESLRGMTTLRLLGSVPRARGRLQARSDELHRATVRTMRVSLVDTALIDVAVQGGALVAVALAVHDAGNGGGAALSSYLVLLLSSEVFRPVRDLSRAWHAGYLGTSAVGALVALGAGTERRDLPGTDVVPDADANGGAQARVTSGAVLVEDVTFTYPGAPGPVLDGVSARFEPGAVTAVVGPSGAGKSTLLDVVLGHLTPGSGRVHRGGLPVRPEDVAVVTQRPVLFEGTVRDNLSVGRPGVDDAVVLRACSQAGILDEVMAMPGGLDAHVAAAGATVSGGQRQRLALARAIVADRPIVLADEPTSALDGDAARAVTRALADLARERVVVVVAHRVESLAGVSRVLELADARLVARQGASS